MRSIAVFLIAWILSSVPAFAQEAAWVKITLPSGAHFRAEVFDTPESRTRGLMFRDSLEKDAAALFIFDRPGRYGFWMKNCRIPLDIVWLDDRHRVVDIAADVPSCPGEYCPIYTPAADATFAIEFTAGTAARAGIVRESRIRFDLGARSRGPR